MTTEIRTAPKAAAIAPALHHAWVRAQEARPYSRWDELHQSSFDSLEQLMLAIEAGDASMAPDMDGVNAIREVCHRVIRGVGDGPIADERRAILAELGTADDYFDLISKATDQTTARTANALAELAPAGAHRPRQDPGNHHENRNNQRGLSMSTTERPVYLTVKQLCENHPALNEGGVRHWIFNAESNGLAKAIKRIGRKVLIDETKFLAWIEEQN